jgi:TetR/AcrR family transcriptional repressor of bet genes
MTGDRRKFRREGEERRREALIAAAVDLVAENGSAGATVRAIADRAGVTPGLIRHYFQTKEDLTRAAYAEVMGRMTGASVAAVAESAAPNPAAQLAAFVLASLRPPVASITAVGLWAGFIHQAQRDHAMRETHRTTYLDYRDRLEAMIAALPREVDAARLRADAIACNAVIDGLWLEISTLPEAFEPGEVERIALSALGAILGVDLAGAA